MPDFSLSFLHSLVVSLSLGAIIGLVRQWADQQEQSKAEIAGIRTYGLWALVGCVSAHLSVFQSPLVFPAAMVVIAVFLITTNVIEKKEERHLGLTSFTVALLTFFIGGLVYWEEYTAGIVITAAIMLLIATKPFFHEWTRRLTKEDIFIVVQFAAVTGLILPLVPNEGYGYLEAFNPFSIWLMVVLISGLGFVGYVAMRLIGARGGIALTGLAGGLASSTATTLALSRNSKADPELAPLLAVGIIIANTVMLGRIAAIVAALHWGLFIQIIIPFLLIALPGILWTLWAVIRPAKDSEVDTPHVKNPLSLKIAIKFALLYGLIVFLVKLTQEVGAEAGFFPIAFLSGLTDMDAISLSLANLVRDDGIVLERAARGIVIAALSNTLFKGIFAFFLGHRDLRRPILLGMGPMIPLAGIGFFLI